MKIWIMPFWHPQNDLCRCNINGFQKPCTAPCPRSYLRRLVAQPAVNGADLGRLNQSLLQPAAGGDVEIEVELVEPRRCPTGCGENLRDALRIGEGEGTSEIQRLVISRQIKSEDKFNGLGEE
jgi:hypothetical protein